MSDQRIRRQLRLDPGSVHLAARDAKDDLGPERAVAPRLAHRERGTPAGGLQHDRMARLFHEVEHALRTKNRIRQLAQDGVQSLDRRLLVPFKGVRVARRLIVVVVIVMVLTSYRLRKLRRAAQIEEKFGSQPTAN